MPAAPDFSKYGYPRSEIRAAIWAGDPDRLRAALADGADPNESLAGGACFLGVAARLNGAALCRLLIDAGAELDHKDNLGRTPLWIAAAEETIEAAAVLMEAGADMEAVDDLAPWTIASMINRACDRRENGAVTMAA